MVLTLRLKSSISRIAFHPAPGFVVELLDVQHGQLVELYFSDIGSNRSAAYSLLANPLDTLKYI